MDIYDLRRIEALARELCRKDGIDPDSTNWMGDASVPHGTVSWPRWKEYEEEARSALKAAERC